MEPGSSLIVRSAPRTLKRRPLRTFARLLESRVAKGRPFTCVLDGDEELRRLNRQFRGKDYATDVLSFPGDGSELGEIAISVDRAREQAREYGHSVDAELRILMLHGVLHLTGMDHERDRGEMSRAERRWRREFGLPAGLIERASC
ncbi:MAG: rRNA maturation RNase YbeY [Bryobacteraceae bacterium]|nr:rRNA maturation RNase YbeY [Bryobacteraceae bacterium]